MSLTLTVPVGVHNILDFLIKSVYQICINKKIILNKILDKTYDKINVIFILKSM